jgi:hypothetical protein
MRGLTVLIVAVLPAGSPEPAAAQTRLPEGHGLSAKYPRDAGIGKDPAVLLHEDFEAGGIADLSKRWNEVSNKDQKVPAFLDDPTAPAGKRSLQMTATLGRDTGGHLYKRFSRGVDCAFARFYVKFDKDAGYVHHFVNLGGYNPPTNRPQGHAGVRPNGNDRFTVGIEPTGRNGRHEPPGVWNFYAYWHEMKMSADKKYWGNGLFPATPVAAVRDRRQCLELMIKCNSRPGVRDGEPALWVDGRLAGHFRAGARRTAWTGMGFSPADQGGEPFEGFSWRTTDDLKVNFFILSHYVTENAARFNRVADPNPICRVSFDDVVVATEYVGRIKP